MEPTTIPTTFHQKDCVIFAIIKTILHLGKQPG